MTAGLTKRMKEPTITAETAKRAEKTSRIPGDLCVLRG